MAGRPLLAASMAFVGGVVLGGWLPQEAAAWGCAGAVLLAAGAALQGARLAAAGTAAGLALFAVAGIFRCQVDLAPLFCGSNLPVEGDVVAAGRIRRAAVGADGVGVLELEEVRLRRREETLALNASLQVLVPPGSAGATGDLVTLRGRLREIRGDRNLAWFPGPVAPRGRRHAARLVVDSPLWVRVDGHRADRGPEAAVMRWRSRADAFWKSRPGAAGEILNALTTGERAGIPADVQETFLRSGLTHLLAISGMNVGFLAALVFLGLRRSLALWEALALRCPTQPLAAALALPSLWFFMIFSGSQIPVGRAVLSSGAGLAAVVLWRRVDPWDAWAIAALGLVALDPRALFTASFQLSFAAVAALLLVAPRLRRQPQPPGLPETAWPHRLRRGARCLFCVSLAASLATAPLVAFHFQQVSLVGPVANLVAVPYAGLVVLPAGWLSLGAAAVSEPAGALAADAAVALAEGLVAIAAWFAEPSWAVVHTARPPLLLALCLLALAGTLLPPPSLTGRVTGVAACGAAAVLAAVWPVAAHRGELLVAFLDVGQGLACAVVAPGGRSLLFDAGPKWSGYDAGERIVVPSLRRLGLWRLDALAVSHRHPDHDGGSAAVRRAFAGVRDLAGEGGRGLVRGAELALGPRVRLRALNPPAEASGRQAADVNDGSLALLLTCGDAGLVLTGDAGPAMLPGIAAAASPHPPRLILQVPHHGGSAEAARLCAEAFGPEVSVIPVGRNSFGHPKQDAVRALGSRGRVLRTDRDGAVFIRSDGSSLAVRTWREMTTGRTWPERVRWLVAGW